MERQRKRKRLDEQRMKQKLSKKQRSGLGSTPARQLNFVNILPAELVSQIFQRCSIRCRLRLLRVSKAWKNFLEGDHQLWDAFDFPGAGKSVKASMITAHFRRLSPQASKVNLSAVEDKMYPWVLRRLHNYRSLTSFVMPIDYDANPVFADLGPVAQGLRHLELSGRSPMGWQPKILHIQTVLSLLGSCKSLESFRAQNLDGISAQALLTDQDTTVGPFETVKAVDLTFTDDRYGVFSNGRRIRDGSLDFFFNAFTNAERLRISHLYDAAFSLSKMTKLKSLHLRYTNFPDLEPLSDSLQNLTLDELQSGVLPDPVEALRIRTEQTGVNFPCLTTLAWQFKASPVPFLEILSRKSQQRAPLKGLKLLGVPLNLSEMSMFARSGLFKDLTALQLSSLVDSRWPGLAIDSLEDNFLFEATPYMPKLRRINLSSTDITGVGIKHIFTTCEKLISFTAYDCYRVADDAMTIYTKTGKFRGSNHEKF